MELKDEDYKEPSVTKELPSYLKIFEYGRNIVDRLDVMCERVLLV